MFGYNWTDLASIATVISVMLTAAAALAALVAFVPGQIARARALAAEKYTLANDRWREFLAIAVQYPEYRLVEMNPARFPPDDGGQDARLEAILQMLTSVFETAVLAYQHAGSSRRKAEFEGWLGTIDEYCKRPDYQAWWRRRIAAWGDKPGFSGYELGFETEILKRLAKHGQPATPQFGE
ncbi:MAG: hypothetical protein R3C46_14610 [Hyphomonadaceae bacterium]